MAGNCKILLHGILMVVSNDALSAFTVFTAFLKDMINRLRAVGEKTEWVQNRAGEPFQWCVP
jgi:hypothetical protein